MSYPGFVVFNFIASVLKSFDFTGRATRKEYFSYLLAYWALYLLVMATVPILTGVLQLFTFFASWSLLARRFRDAGVTPWAILLFLPIFIVIFLPSKEGQK